MINLLVSFHLLGSPCERKVNHVKPRENTGKDGPQDGAVPLPGTYNSDRRTESDSCLRDSVCCLVGDLSKDHHRVITER